MPTFERTARFRREFRQLTRDQRQAVLAMVRLFVAGLRTGRFDPQLRLKRVQGSAGIWEVSWAPDGRATFSYGPELQPGEAHVIWRRVGTHSIFREP